MIRILNWSLFLFIWAVALALTQAGRTLAQPPSNPSSGNHPSGGQAPRPSSSDVRNPEAPFTPSSTAPRVGSRTNEGDPDPAQQQTTADRAAKYRIDKELAMFQKIRDDAPFPWAANQQLELADAGDFALEERAYDEVLRHARQFPTAELEAHARRDVTLKDLYYPGRLSYKLDLLYFEGRLRQLRRAEPTEILKESGITDVYEAWIFPKGEAEPLCVFCTELPPTIRPQQTAYDKLDYWVGVAGYSFKLMQYESRKLDANRPEKNVMRRAPVLMAHGLTLLEEPPATASAAWRETFLPVLLAGIAAMVLIMAGLTWYFRRGDRAVREALEAKRAENPFDR